MIYNVHFDIASFVIVLMAIPLFFIRSPIPTRSNLYFFIFQLGLLLAAGFNISSSLLINIFPASSASSIIVLSTFYYIFHNSLSFLMCLYIFSVLYPKGTPKLLVTPFVLLWISVLALIIANLHHPLLFFVDPEKGYRHGPHIKILYLIVFSFILAACLLIFKHRKNQGLRKISIYFFALILPSICIIIQRFLPTFMLETFGATFAMLFILLTIQNSSDLIEPRSGLPGRPWLYPTLEELFIAQEPITLLVLHTYSLERLKNYLDPDSFENLYHIYSDWLSGLTDRRRSIATLSEGIQVLIVHNQELLPASASVRDYSFTDTNEPGELALQLVKRAQIPWDIENLSLRLPLHVLLLNLPEDIDNFDDFNDIIHQFVEVDENLNRHIFFKKDFISQRNRKETITILKLEESIRKKEIDPIFQPIISIQKNKVVSLEVLCEFLVYEENLSQQKEVCILALESGLSKPLFSLLLDSALKLYKKQKLKERGIRFLEFKLNEGLLSENRWDELVLNIAEKNSISPRHICLAIPESLAVQRVKNLKSCMKTLKGYGVLFTLDNYGADYTDLELVLSLPFDFIKLDKTFVKEGLANRKGRLLLAGSIAMFSELEKTVIARGIESLEAAQALALLGAQCLQGYYYSHPLPLEDFLKEDFKNFSF